MSVTVTSHVTHLPLFHGTSVTPSGRLPSVLDYYYYFLFIIIILIIDVIPSFGVTDTVFPYRFIDSGRSPVAVTIAMPSPNYFTTYGAAMERCWSCRNF